MGNDVEVRHGDCLSVMRQLPDASVDAIVTDPPYGLGFMGKAWDDLPPGEVWGRECLRVLKPGGYLLAFGGSRTWHRLAVAVEDAGFELRDSIAWLYGSGFPKSLDVSKAIDKAAGAERETKPWVMRTVDAGKVFSDRATTATSGNLQCPNCLKWKYSPDYCKCPKDDGPQTEAAQQWQGWGTALKPAFEPIVVGRKHFPGTVAANVLEHGTGALNIDGCRIGTADALKAGGALRTNSGDTRTGAALGMFQNGTPNTYEQNPAGRWPTNVVLDESQAAELDQQTGYRQPGSFPAAKGIIAAPGANGTMGGGWSGSDNPVRVVLDGGGASRFFPVFRYQAKAPTKERPEGADGNRHPTVKPLALMRWLVRLVTPPGGLVLDPFAGSGTTGEACAVEGFRCLLIEQEAAYLPMIAARLDRAQPNGAVGNDLIA